MLREIYLSAGGVGTFFIAVGMFVSFVGWMMALTETITRASLSRAAKAGLILLISLLPPLGVVLTAWYVRLDRRSVSRAMRAFKQAEKSGTHVNEAQLAARAA
ncbi:MAG: hypothetical protein OXT73_11670 [Bacteroidota bacterium]|nr:hypothetical protein [Bacteroidota bacterium]